MQTADLKIVDIGVRLSHDTSKLLMMNDLNLIDEKTSSDNFLVYFWLKILNFWLK